MDDDQKLEAIRNATPGTRIRWSGPRGLLPAIRVLSHRKDDDSGWRLADGSGLDDDIFVSGDWEFAD